MFRTLESTRLSSPAIPGVLGAIDAWLGLWRERRDLERLNDAALRDIGLSRDEARREAARPFWDRPAGRR